MMYITRCILEPFTGQHACYQVRKYITDLKEVEFTDLVPPGIGTSP